MLFPILFACLPQSPDDRLARLEAEIAALRAEIAAVRASERAEREAQVAALSAELDAARRASGGGQSKFTWGGYGEHHFNDLDGHGSSQLDIHRLVLYMGYEFSETIRLHSEIEFEHGFVADGNGELVLEQLYTEFQVCPTTHLQVGRMLAPLGIVNLRHEPPAFNGVERPAVETAILPSTWFVDGIGVSGEIHPSLRYRLLLTGGLDGSGFSAINGIRGGRQEERPSFHDPALSGRLDYFALDGAGEGDATLRLGLSAFVGGLDNGNQGNDPGLSADLAIVAVDAEASVGDFDLRGVAAYESIDGARELSTATGQSISEEIVGWYLECAWHWLPASWGDGDNGWHDARLFVRYDDLDTQRDVPSGLTADPRGDRNEWTVGVGLYPLPNLVLKADYQFRDDASSTDPRNQFNLGIGWSF